jgi:hypothetical protein
MCFKCSRMECCLYYHYYFIWNHFSFLKLNEWRCNLIVNSDCIFFCVSCCLRDNFLFTYCMSYHSRFCFQVVCLQPVLLGWLLANFLRDTMGWDSPRFTVTVYYNGIAKIDCIIKNEHYLLHLYIPIHCGFLWTIFLLVVNQQTTAWLDKQVLQVLLEFVLMSWNNRSYWYLSKIRYQEDSSWYLLILMP